MKTVRLTKKQKEQLIEKGHLWGRKYYYEIEEQESRIVKYREIYYMKDNGRRFMTDVYADYNNLWKWAKIGE